MTYKEVELMYKAMPTDKLEEELEKYSSDCLTAIEFGSSIVASVNANISVVIGREILRRKNGPAN